MQNSSSNNGYSLIELLSVLVIVAMISSIAYPIYASAQLRLNRVEAKQALLSLQNSYERYFMTHNSYEKAKIGEGSHSILATDITTKGGYKLEISEQKAGYYVLTAIPYSSSAKKDLECASFTLSSYGEKDITGTGNIHTCWNR